MDVKRRQMLLAAARSDLSYREVNHQLAQAGFLPVGQEEWYVWHKLYAVIVRNNPVFEAMLVNEGKSLNWFARALKAQHERRPLS